MIGGLVVGIGGLIEPRALGVGYDNIADMLDGRTLATAALTCADPAVVVLRTPSLDGLPAGHPAFGKPAGAEGAAAYVCRRNVCGLPIADQRALAMALAVRNG